MAAAGGMAGGVSSARRNGLSSPPRAAAARASQAERAKASAALWEARLAATEASRAEYREAAHLLARNNAELLCRQRHLESDTMAVMSFLRKQDQEKAEEIEKLKQQLIDLKQQAQEENRKLADQYTQQVKELEEKFQKKVKEIGLIQLELRLIKEFRRKKAVMEKELEDLKERMETSDRRHQEVVVKLEKRFLEEKEMQQRFGHFSSSSG